LKKGGRKRKKEREKYERAGGKTRKTNLLGRKKEK